MSARPFIAAASRQQGQTALQKSVVVAFTGKAGTGKDSAATVLVNHRQFLSIAFADALRREISATWRIDERMLTHRPTKELRLPALAIGMCGEPSFTHWCFESGECLHEPRSPRWVMQQWASFRRRFNPGHYACVVTRWIQRQVGLGFTHFAITDLRDPVEVAALRLLGVQLHIVRIHSRRATYLTGDTARHSSERHQVDADHEITNDSSLQALAETVLALPLTPVSIAAHAHPACSTDAFSFQTSK